MRFIIGGRGRLGQAIFSRHGAGNAMVLDRAVYENWWRDGARDEISRFFAAWEGSSSTVFVAAGILDPSLAQDLHMNINYQLPKNIIEGVTKLGLKTVTFGTVMEQLPGAPNPYTLSKVQLGNYVAGLPVADHGPAHFRVHTLYGRGQPSAFMFLGQILNCLRTESEFRMTQGLQLREYHHVEDDMRAVQLFLDSGFSGAGNLSHGQPVSLAALATFVFQAFNAERLLRIGGLPEPVAENYDQKFNRPQLLSGMEFRETLQGVTDYLKTCSRALENQA